MIVRFVKNDGTLSKRYWERSDPADVWDLAQRYDKKFIGFGIWSNKPEPFVCIAEGKHIEYIMADYWQPIEKWMNHNVSFGDKA
jgi:hypothetical protein